MINYGNASMIKSTTSYIRKKVINNLLQATPPHPLHFHIVLIHFIYQFGRMPTLGELLISVSAVAY